MATLEKNTSFIKKVAQAGHAYLDSLIVKAKTDLRMENDDENAFYRKAVYRDPTYNIASQGYHEKTARLSFYLLKNMAYKSSVVSAIIQTRQNQIAAFSKIAKDTNDKGFKIVLKDHDKQLEKIKEELFGEKAESDVPEKTIDAVSNSRDPIMAEVDADANEDGEISDKEQDRLAKEELEKRTRVRREEIERLILTCGEEEDRSFESKKWNFDAFLRAVVRDSLIYDQFAVEFVPDEVGRLHHFIPVDGATIRYASPSLKNYKEFPLQGTNYDILFPEKELEALEDTDALELDSKKLENDAYKYVQIVRGKIERAFTENELAIGMRNPVTDIYANGYSIAELEVLLRLISSHIFTENYNHSYYTQGFSAKGILHIKAPLPRRKLETLRIEWQHWLKGNRNSFQTPIFAGMDEVKWIPLTQSHSDMEFSNWMNYLIKMVCSIFQIDPSEIGFGMKDEGGKGGGISGDNTAQKMQQSKDRGLVPMVRFLENFINTQIIKKFDDEYCLEFVGLREEDKKERILRQEKEVKYKKSLNEIRAEDNLAPIPGCDDLILDQVFFQWFSTFHPDGRKLQEQQMEQQQDMASNENPNEQDTSEQEPQEGGGGEIDNVANKKQNEEQALINPMKSTFGKSFKKPEKLIPLKIEYYGDSSGS